MADDLPILHVYMDESGQTANRYMCVSGIAINRNRLAEVRAGIEAIKEAGGIGSEVKWSRVTSHRLRTYRRLVEYFFSLVEQRQIHFHALVVDFSQFDHAKNGSREGSVSRMLFLLARRKFSLTYGAKANLHLFPDSGDHADMFCEHRYHLNNAVRRDMPEWRRSSERPVAHIEPTVSSTEPLLQLNDVILGAICYRRNERYLDPGASKHKRLLARMIAESVDATTFHYNPKAYGRRFTVWNLKDPTKLKLGRRAQGS